MFLKVASGPSPEVKDFFVTIYRQVRGPWRPRGVGEGWGGRLGTAGGSGSGPAPAVPRLVMGEATGSWSLAVRVSDWQGALQGCHRPEGHIGSPAREKLKATSVPRQCQAGQAAPVPVVPS